MRVEASVGVDINWSHEIDVYVLLPRHEYEHLTRGDCIESKVSIMTVHSTKGWRILVSEPLDVTLCLFVH